MSRKLEITEVRIFPTKDSGKIRAYATIVLEGCLVVRDLKVVEGEKGYFVSMPSRRKKDGTFKDIVHPIETDMRRYMEDSIITEYRTVMEKNLAL